MSKKEIVREISEEVGLTQLQTGEIVQKTLDAISQRIASDFRVELRNFGVFEVKVLAATSGRNPHTGERVTIPRRHVIVFKAGKYMNHLMQESVGENSGGLVGEDSCDVSEDEDVLYDEMDEME